MNLVKIGKRILNLDNVTLINTEEKDYDDHPCIKVYFNYASGPDSLTAYQCFYGPDAQVLKYWLSYRVSDADRDYQLYLAGKRWAERDTELYMAFHAYQEAGGELEAAEWIVAGEPVQD